MKRRKFLITGAFSTLASMPVLGNKTELKEDQQFIEWRIYKLLDKSKQKILDNYLELALIPALNRQGCDTIGVFKEIDKPDTLEIHMFIPYASPDNLALITEALENDETYNKKAKAYLSLTKDEAVFERVESSLLLGFKAMPRLKSPENKKKVYELRTYESFNEDAGRRKIDMFNRHEVELFKNLGYNAVFYSKMITGKFMPALTYMVCFDSMEEMEEKWKSFGTSEVWVSIKDLPEYANSVSKIHKSFLEPLPYSQI